MQAILKKITAEMLTRINNKSLKIKAKTFFWRMMTLAWGEGLVPGYIWQRFFLKRALLECYKICKPCMTFFDVVRAFWLLYDAASRLVGAGGQVHAFEPTKSSYECLFSKFKGVENIL